MNKIDKIFLSEWVEKAEKLYEFIDTNYNGLKKIKLISKKELNQILSNNNPIEEINRIFKEKVSNICIKNNLKFAFNENNSIFESVRKYYATAVILTLTSNDMHPSKINEIIEININVKLKSLKEFDFDKKYYEEVIVEDKISKTYEKFVTWWKYFYFYIDGNTLTEKNRQNKFEKSTALIELVDKYSWKDSILTEEEINEIISKSWIKTLLDSSWMIKYNSVLKVLFNYYNMKDYLNYHSVSKNIGKILDEVEEDF